MAAPESSDAFVFFVATGDRAYKQIFPALQTLIRYEPATWPAAAACAVIAGDEGWHDPKPEEIARC